MTVTLNFGKADKEQLKGILSGLEKAKTNTDFEEARWKAQGCTVTLYSSGKLVIQGEKKKWVKEMVLEGMAGTEEIALGIDETGRGESFGPMAIAGVLGDKNRLRELRDSKKTGNISGKRAVVSKNALAVSVVEISSEQIDAQRRAGITLDEMQAKAVKAIVFALNPSGEWPVLVDGKPLKGCNGFKFIVKGDDIEPVIGAASVIAKYTRNKSMDRGKRKTWKNNG